MCVCVCVREREKERCGQQHMLRTRVLGSDMNRTYYHILVLHFTTVCLVAYRSTSSQEPSEPKDLRNGIRNDNPSSPPVDFSNAREFSTKIPQFHLRALILMV